MKKEVTWNQQADEFRERLIADITERFPEIEFTPRDVIKNNGIVCHGISCRMPESNIAPTMYIDNDWEAFSNGDDYGEMFNALASAIEREVGRIPEIDASADLLKKERVLFKLVNSERNAELLETVPHRTFLDLAEVYYLQVSFGGGEGSILITDEIQKSMDVSEEELHELAVQNARRLKPRDLRPIAEVVQELCEASGAWMPPLDDGPSLMVLTSEDKTFGAINMALPEVMAEAAEAIGGDFYILPSSVHEILLMPESHGSEEEMLAQLVREVNSTEVSPNEVLSDSVYFYSREKGEVTKVQ